MKNEVVTYLYSFRWFLQNTHIVILLVYYCYTFKEGALNSAFDGRGWTFASSVRF